MPSSPYTTPQTNGESVLGPPSPIHYHFAMSRLAYVFYIYIKANTHHTPSKFSKAIEEITTVRTNLPLHLTDQFPATQDDEQWELEHPWVPFQRFLLTQVIDFMLLSIARVLAVKELGANTSKYRHVALESATRILRNYSRPVPRTYKLVWVVSASTVAAAIYTALHTLATRADGQGFSRLQVVELLTRTAAELKSHAAVANHAAHGSNTIQNLLQVMAQKEAGIPEDPGSIHDVLRQVSSLCSVQSSPFAHDFAQQAANMDLVDIADLDAILNDGDSHFAGPMDTWDDLWMGF